MKQDIVGHSFNPFPIQLFPEDIFLQHSQENP